MKQNLHTYLKLSGIVLVVILIVVVVFISVGSRVKTNVTGDKLQSVGQNKLTLEVDSYGYEIGDVVEIKKGQVDLGDVVVYDPFKNKSMCLGMGPHMSLGEVIGTPGEAFSFQNSELKIGTEMIKFDKDYSREKAVFGGQKYNTLIGKEITLLNGEYLMDKRVGSECFTEELDETGSSIAYNRFTVNEDAIIGIIVKKIGHDKQAEEEFRDRIY